MTLLRRGQLALAQLLDCERGAGRRRQLAWFVYNAHGLRRLARFCARALLRQGHRDAHRGAWSGPAASGLAQSVGLAAVLYEGRGDGRCRASLGQRAAGAECAGHRVRLGDRAAAGVLRGRCCCGCRFPSMPIRWPTVRCRSFIPVWWPHSWYNTRYGMELLPAFALGLGFVAQFAIGAVREFKPRWAKYRCGRRSGARGRLNRLAGHPRAAAGLRGRHQEHRGAPAVRREDSAGAAATACARGRARRC